MRCFPIVDDKWYRVWLSHFVWMPYKRVQSCFNHLNASFIFSSTILPTLSRLILSSSKALRAHRKYSLPFSLMDRRLRNVSIHIYNLITMSLIPAANKSTEIVITEVNKAYRAEDTDILLVSSDEVIFKVHSYHLFSAR